MFGFLVILLCIAAYFHCKHHGCPYKSERTHQDALDIVRERYARGEISSEEFIERKKTLEEGEHKK